MRVKVRPTSHKKNSEIAAEWDTIAHRRHMQIVSGKDISYVHILRPTAMRLLERCDLASILDIGCGTGDLTCNLAKLAGDITCVDLSQECVRLARETCSENRNVRFFVGSLEVVAEDFKRYEFTTAVAAMTLMTAPDLRAVVEALGRLIKPSGHVVATIVHPCFWPTYWGYADEEWFSYPEETFIEGPFQISLDCAEMVTTHIHRPLNQYVKVFRNQGFVLEAALEPMPSPEVQSMYPEPWKYPRFLGLRWHKVS